MPWDALRQYGTDSEVHSRTCDETSQEEAYKPVQEGVAGVMMPECFMSDGMSFASFQEGVVHWPGDEECYCEGNCHGTPEEGVADT